MRGVKAYAAPTELWRDTGRAGATKMSLLWSLPGVAPELKSRQRTKSPELTAVGTDSSAIASRTVASKR